MLAVISPAKNLNFDPAPLNTLRTDPAFLSDANVLAKAASKLSVSKIKAMMALSDTLAQLNHQRFQAFQDQPSDDVIKQAALAFNGDTYSGLSFATLDPDTQVYSQAKLRILSGLYGVLRPFDAIQPYRLEMGRKLKTRRGETLYDYWDTKIAQALDAQAADQDAQAIVNLASVEYFSAVKEATLKTQIITPVFLEDKAGVQKVISFYAKKARGSMARWMMMHRTVNPVELRDFTEGGYCFDSAQSSPQKPVFVRKSA